MDLAECTLQVIENPTQKQIEPIVKGLYEFNQSQVGKYGREGLVIYARDANSQVVGGVYAWLLWGWLYIDDIWLENSYRGKGIGSKLLLAAELFAMNKGVFNARLNTGSFQAPEFYQKNGYEIFAQLDITGPDGLPYIDYLLKKKL